MSALLAREYRQSGGDAIKRATQIHVDHGIPTLHVQRVEAGDWPDPGTVDDDVEPAALLNRKGNKFFEITSATNIGSLEYGPSAAGGYSLNDGPEPIFGLRAVKVEASLSILAFNILYAANIFGTRAITPN